MLDFHALFVVVVGGRKTACAANTATFITKIFEFEDVIAGCVQSVIKEQREHVTSSLALGTPT